MNPLVLTLCLSLLPPTAHRHNEQAMDLDEAGRLDEAAREFTAAYAAMPDPRADREGREQVLGSLRGLLLRQHQQTGAPQPLCRLRGLLRDHLAQLEASHADTPDRIEISGNRERLAEVETQLAAFPPDACAAATADEPAVAPAPPPTPAAAAPPTPAPRPSTPTAPADGPTPRQLRITGGVTAALGGALLGVMIYGLVDAHQHTVAGREIDANIGDRPITRDEFAALHDHLDQARFSRNLAIATGISSGIFSLFSLALFVRANNTTSKSTKSTTRQNAVYLAPWRLPGGAGLTLRVRLP